MPRSTYKHHRVSSESWLEYANGMSDVLRPVVFPHLKLTMQIRAGPYSRSTFVRSGLYIHGPLPFVVDNGLWDLADATAFEVELWTTLSLLLDSLLMNLSGKAGVHMLPRQVGRPAPSHGPIYGRVRGGQMEHHQSNRDLRAQARCGVFVTGASQKGRRAIWFPRQPTRSIIVMNPARALTRKIVDPKHDDT